MPTESKPITLGVKCPDFNLRSVNDSQLSLNHFAKSKLLVVAFTCNHCPYVQAYEERLNSLVQDYSDRGVAFVCINSNDEKAYPDDSFANMKSRAKEKGFLFHYLRDETQSVARLFNAACTPEFYVYDQERLLRYHGRLDDNYKEPQKVQHTYLKNALEALLNGTALSVEQTSAIGCSIKWKV